jgi:hypothetical protein
MRKGLKWAEKVVLSQSRYKFVLFCAFFRLTKDHSKVPWLQIQDSLPSITNGK